MELGLAPRNTSDVSFKSKRDGEEETEREGWARPFLPEALRTLGRAAASPLIELHHERDRVAWMWAVGEGKGGMGVG